MAFISLNSSDYIDKINSLVKPEYESKYNDTISQLMDKIANKEKFSYDFNADPLYQNYKDNYVKLGNEAAMNAAASVSGLTGGYGNSYAATAASQANQQYLTQLNNVIPELYNAAMNKYKMEVEDMYNQFGMYETEEQRLYGQHRDNVSDYYSDWSNLQQGFGTALSHEEFLESMGYQKERDAVADSQWERNFQLAAQKAAAKGGSSSGSKAKVDKSKLSNLQFADNDNQNSPTYQARKKNIEATARSLSDEQEKIDYLYKIFSSGDVYSSKDYMDLARILGI